MKKSNEFSNPVTSHATKSIAVLPFVNMSSDPDNEYFSDGITEEIINALTKVQGLKVIARTSSFSFKNKNVDVRTIGEKLGVNLILEGSIRKVKNKVRITAQLIEAADGSHLWAKNIDRELENIFELQDEISLLIADQIREHFGHLNIQPHLHSIPTKSPEAYDLLLKGSYFLKRKDLDDVKKALGYFQSAVDLDPNYAEAYAYIGETYLHHSGFGLISSTEAHAKARNAAKKAIQLNEQEPLAHKVMAYIHFFYDWDWDAALKEYNLAIQYGLSHQNEFITYYYIFIEKDYDRAINIAKKVLETDPLHIITHWQLGLCYYFAERFEEALFAFQNALDFDHNFAEAHRWKGLVLGYLGKYEPAIEAINRALEISNGEGIANIDRLTVKILRGEKEEVLLSIQNMDFMDSSDPASLYALLNMPDEAIFWLEKAYQERSVMLVSLKHFWIWDNLRSDTRFQKIYERMNFTEQSNYVPKAVSAISAKEIQKATASLSLMSEKEINILLPQLKKCMEVENLYLDPALSLRFLAKRLDVHPNKLSWLLNEFIGNNFNGYVNTFRLVTFKQKALDPNNSHLTLLGLAYESGFNSKTVFNAFFKKMENMTPRAWVKSQKE